MKTRIYRILLASLALGLSLSACKDNDKPDPSIHALKPELGERTAFDQWIRNNYTDAYNVQLLYNMEDIQADRSRNLAPASLENSMKLAKIVLHAWYGAYDEVTGGTDFMRRTSPRQLFFIGSAMWNGDGTITQGTAEGGLKVTLFQVNWLNVNDPQALNKTFFKVMHHEFSHILHQNKIWPDEYNTISTEYSPNAWANRRSLSDYAPLGFVTAYASSQPREDIAEVTAALITFTDAEWAAILKAAGDEGRARLNKKIAIVKKYMLDTWGVDMDRLRAVALRRLAEAPRLQLLEADWTPLITGRALPLSPEAIASARSAAWGHLSQQKSFLDLSHGHTPGDDRCALLPMLTH